MEFHLSYLKSWTMMLWKCCTQFASKFGKLSSGHRTEKGQFLKGNTKECSNYCTIALISVQFSSVQFSHSVVSDSLPPHELKHARPSCPSPTPRVFRNSYPLSQWCHPIISSSVTPFFSCPQSLPASQSFPMSHLFTWGGQSTGVSASASFPPKKS